MEENVELEKVYENGSLTLAIGGTWELKGKAMVGIAPAIFPKITAVVKMHRKAMSTGKLRGQLALCW